MQTTLTFWLESGKLIPDTNTWVVHPHVTLTASVGGVLEVAAPRY